ncbi:MAG TPA: photosynthetic reaction center cytochrome c subunit family protein [Pyrinomonadaceae bacterium]|jgi:hypothetical protein|nr:photosynthetic reaction center cytochrome c subunit family protein [Pyrinomonadaceae bacterium]
MKRALKIILLALAGVGFAIAQGAGRQEKAAERTAGQVYKNIQVFNDLPASQLPTVMNFMAGSLGVKCSHCHSGPFERDDKPAKQAARRMIRMVFDLNRGSFGGASAVTCYTCHRGRPTPVSVPAVGANPWQGAAATDAKPAATLPSVAQVFDRYVEALGGRAAILGQTTRVMKGSRVGADGVLVPEEVYQKAPNKSVVLTRYPEFVLRRGFDGKTGWGMDAGGPALLSPQDVAELERDADFYKEADLGRLYAEARVTGEEKIGGRRAYVVGAKARDGSSERLYFDAETGLLVRRDREVKIALGLFPTETDYEDYREVGGVKIPFALRWSMPGRSWGRRIAEVKYNEPVEDTIFTAAAATKG